MKKRSLLVIPLVIVMLFTFVACNEGRNPKETEPTNTPVPTDTPKPTDTPVPTAEPTPDPDAELDAVLYRFALEGEDIVDTMFDGAYLAPQNATLEYTDEGLLITVDGITDPYFSLPLQEGSLDVTKYTVLKVLFKNSSKTTVGEFLISFDGEPIEGVDQLYRFDTEDTDDWQVIYMDFSVVKPSAEMLTIFRVDLLSNPPIDSTITIDYIGFFTSMEEAEGYTPPNRRS